MAENENLLSDEELDALAEGVRDGTVETDTGLNTGATAVRHDLTSEDASLGVNTSAIDMINERFIRHLRGGFVTDLRTTPKTQGGEIETLRYASYLRNLQAPLSVNVVRINGLIGYSLVVIEPPLIFSALENFFGGFGEGVGELPPTRVFTPTESTIINLILKIVFDGLSEAWAPVMPIECELVNQEINPQFAQIVDENELVVLSRFKLTLGDKVDGSIDILYPYGALKPIRDALRSRVQSAQDDASSNEWSQELRNAAGEAELDVRVTLVEIQSTVSELQKMKVGDMLPFTRPGPAVVNIEGTPLFEAEVGSNGAQSAIRITGNLST